jgi:hypothetical protein
MRKSFENPPSLRLAAWPAADYPDVTGWGAQAASLSISVASRNASGFGFHCHKRKTAIKVLI